MSSCQLFLLLLQLCNIFCCHFAVGLKYKEISSNVNVYCPWKFSSSLIPRLYTRPPSGGPPEVVPDESLGETRGNMAIKTRGKVLGCRLYCKAGLVRSRYTFPWYRFVNNKINKHTSKK